MPQAQGYWGPKDKKSPRLCPRNNWPKPWAAPLPPAEILVPSCLDERHRLTHGLRSVASQDLETIVKLHF